MNSDCAFAIGKTHDVCEDYARHGLTRRAAPYPDRAFAIVSDGCSGSDDTDFGARALVIAAVSSIGHFQQVKDDWTIWEAKQMIPNWFSTTALDATLLAVYQGGNSEYLTVDVCGDGGVIGKYRNGDISYREFDHGGAPKYLSYKLNPDREAEFEKECGDKRKYTDYLNGVKLDERRATHMACTYMTMDAYAKDHYELVMVVSDGIGSFVDAQFQAVPAVKVVERLADIKSYTGEFLKRRLKWFLTKECPALGWIHTDDLSIAGIHVPVPTTKD